MKVAPVLAAALVIYIAIPGSDQGKGKKPKPKFCRGANGNQYKKGESYEDKEACIRYTCTKKGKTFKMKEEKIQCTEPEPELAANVTAIEASVQFLNSSMESIGNKMEALQSNVSLIEAGMQFLNGSMESVESKMESLQTSVESILGMITAMQSTSSKLEDGAWSAWSSYSACSATCGPATKYRTRTCSDPAPANGGKPCPGLNLQSMDCQFSQCGESELDLAANVTAIEAGMQFLNGSMELIENKMEDLQSNVESVQTSVESILGMITAMQSTSSKLEDGAWSAWSSYSACSATCGPATKYRTRTCSDPAPANGGKPCPGLNLQTMDCQFSQCGESELDLAPNVTAIEAGMQFLNGSMGAIENKMEDLQSNVESIQTSVESILGMITAMQSTSSKLEVNMTSNMDAISSNKKAISSNKNTCSAIETTAAQLEVNITSNMDAISSNKEAISSNKNTCSAIETTTAQLEVNIKSNIDAIISNKEDISSHKNSISTNKNLINTNKVTCSAIQTTAAKLETCLGDVNSTDCPSSEDGKISVVDAIKGNKEDIEALGKPTFNLVVTGGDQQSTQKSSEVISSEKVCSQSIPPLLTGIQQLSTSIFFDNSIWVCGGYAMWKNRCQIFKAGASQWTYGPSLKVERWRHTIIKAGDELIAMGGWRGSSSMEKFSLASGEWTVMSKTMPRGRQDHCSVYFPKTKSVVLTGGWPYTKQIDSFDVVSGQWTQLDPLPKELQQHGCIIMGQSILVAGGFANGERYQKNVYSLNMINGKTWQTFGQLTVAKSYFTMGFVDNKLMIAGGINDDGRLATIDTMEESGVWKESKLSLSVPRSLFAGIMVPTEAFPCHLYMK